MIFTSEEIQRMKGEGNTSMSEESGCEVIYIYTRKQAIEDGVLVDVTNTAKEAGFKFPVAVTRTVWEEYITPPPNTEAQGQSIEGRLWDVLWMLRCAIKPGQGDTLLYQLYFAMKKGRKPILVTLKSICGPGDEGESVITIMKPKED